MRSPCTLFQKVRYWMYPKSRTIDERTEIIEQNISEIKRQKEVAKSMIANVNQPDVLRSLVISMSQPGNNR